MKQKIAQEKILSCLVIRNGEVEFEYYKNKKIPLKPRNIHSVTKSVVGMLIGIALEQELLPSLDTPITEFFPTLEKDPDPRKREITLDHLLTMTEGFDWPEFGAWNAFTPMFYANNWVKFVLERPLSHAPGEKMNYNTGATHLLTAILQNVTGKKAEQYAKEQLFAPLGITNYRWYEDRQGINNGGSGLALTAADMAKLGLLYLQQGMWGNKQIVPQSWVHSSTQPHRVTYEHIGHYARHWWTSAIEPEQPFSEANRCYFALGHGGQYIIVVPSAATVVPSAATVVVFQSEMFEESLFPLRLFREHIVLSKRDLFDV